MPMPPPLRPPESSKWPVDEKGPSRRHSVFDQSLRLPPLQTPIPPSPSRSPVVEDKRVSIPSSTTSPVSAIKSSQHTGSLNTRVTTREPVLTQKIGILSTITEPLPPAGHHGLRGRKRGYFIAVEGTDPKNLDEVGRFLEKVLVASGDVALKVWENDESVDSEGAELRATTRRQGIEAKEAVASVRDDLLSRYFDTILSWRQKSKQIAYHVTGGRSMGDAPNGGEFEGSRVVQALSTEACTPPHDDRSPEAGPKTPVALVKGGHSLTVADSYASAMPISDKYTPEDHWQWLVSLWRGTPHADLVVQVEDCQEKTGSVATVDVSRSIGLVLVRIPKEKGLDEATERRLAFEVMEWMRDGPFREDFASKF
ncbi:hypothetical protein UVI_02000870 [Ustilaginoidea virens]|nr:hypothetical protein UVI_02000870 [Ustilaginoidea virens]